VPFYSVDGNVSSVLGSICNQVSRLGRVYIGWHFPNAFSGSISLAYWYRINNGILGFEDINANFGMVILRLIKTSFKSLGWPLIPD
jgi:hypothetical protein